MEPAATEALAFPVPNLAAQTSQGPALANANCASLRLKATMSGLPLPAAASALQKLDTFSRELLRGRGLGIRGVTEFNSQPCQKAV